MAKIGLLYGLFPLAKSSLYVALFLVVRVVSLSGNHLGEYFGFFSVFRANFSKASLLLSSSVVSAAISNSCSYGRP